MKIIRFRAGGAGLYALPGEYPERELEELLGGETEMVPITRRLALVVRRDEEEKRLPILYALHRLDREPVPIPGECAVVVTAPDGRMSDASHRDMSAAEQCIRAVRQTERSASWRNTG